MDDMRWVQRRLRFLANRGDRTVDVGEGAFEALQPILEVSHFLAQAFQVGCHLNEPIVLLPFNGVFCLVDQSLIVREVLDSESAHDSSFLVVLVCTSCLPDGI